MRVTLLSDEWRRNGGVASYLRRLSSALAARGHDVQVVHNDPAGEPEPGVRDDYAPGATAYGGGTAAAAGALSHIAAFTPDVVHVQSCNNFALEAALRARGRVIKTLHVYDFCPTNTKYHHALERDCVHPTGAMCLPRMGYKRCTTSLRPNVWVRLQRRAAAANRNNAGYHRLIVASEYVRAKALGTGYPPEQVVVLPYFVTGGRAGASAPEPRTILTGGRFTREKGFDLFIDALARVPRPWRAIIAGDGMERAALERRVREAGLLEHVEFAGWQDEAGMRALYARASVVVVPSRWPEPSGIIGLEAMAEGRPVVAFAAGGIPEWLVHGETGLLVARGDSRALGDAIARVLANPEDASRMGRAGRARAESTYSTERHLTALTAIYESLPRTAA